jgi:two-component system NarL family sensor kinase
VENGRVAELTGAVAPHLLPARRVVAVVCACAAAAQLAAGIALYLVNGPAETPGGVDYLPTLLIACASFGLLGALVLARGTAPIIGALMLTTGLGWGLTAVAVGWAVRDLPGAEAAIWLCNWAWVPGYAAVVVMTLVLPDGRVRLRPVAWATVAGAAALAAGIALSPYPLEDLPAAFGSPENPLDVGVAADVLESAGWVVLLACAAIALVALVRRLRRSSGVEEAQLKWVALGGAASAVVLIGAGFAGEHGDVVSAVAMVPLPASIAIAVLRRGLWDVDVVINRSLVYATLTAAGAAVYVAAVSLLGTVVAAALVAVALAPLHRLVQVAVNQLVYGDRDDPAAALRRLGDRLEAAGEADEVLPAVAETVARALRLPSVEVRLGGGVSAGERFPLLHQGRRVGEMVVGGRPLSAADRRALETIARQVAVAAHSVELAHDLRRSRERLVLAREEERRRLRHDLHDELGPTLAALALELEAARERPEQVSETLERAAARAREAVAEVRRLGSDLRPPSLDDLGLVDALRLRAEHLSTGALALSVEGELGPLPAAVEAAAYRIVSEAFANAVRHSRARTCVASLEESGGALEIRVADDGAGLAPGATPGVGLRSMRERAEELGGTFELGSGPGTELRACLPLEAS